MTTASPIMAIPIRRASQLPRCPWRISQKGATIEMPDQNRFQRPKDGPEAPPTGQGEKGEKETVSHHDPGRDYHPGAWPELPSGRKVKTPTAMISIGRRAPNLPAEDPAQPYQRHIDKDNPSD